MVQSPASPGATTTWQMGCKDSVSSLCDHDSICDILLQHPHPKWELLQDSNSDWDKLLLSSIFWSMLRSRVFSVPWNTNSTHSLSDTRALQAHGWGSPVTAHKIHAGPTSLFISWSFSPLLHLQIISTISKAETIFFLAVAEVFQDRLDRLEATWCSGRSPCLRQGRELDDL